MSDIRVLFICKRRSTYGVSYGLINSCRFLSNALIDMGFEAKVVEVIDNNSIDHEVFTYQPTHVFIEALWVVPSKFDELIPLHPDVNWYIRLHSNVPFIAHEGMAIEWLVKYLALGVKYPQFKVSANSEHMVQNLEDTFGIDISYAPNIYQPETPKVELTKPKPDPTPTPPPPENENIAIGCFGAIRPLKNQLIQAMAAVTFANKFNKQLIFHINSTRIESWGEPILRNIEALFASSGHILEVHDWLNHSDFLDLILTMDLGLQVSFSETFDIVAADFAYVNVPVIGSPEIEWLNPSYKADPTDMEDIVDHLEHAWHGRKSNQHASNRQGLRQWNERARKIWKRLLH